ncbi:MAG: GNAT family N-acetyltransferase [Deltaproteobacteria bacterium]|nr:GNAT family N-acetyltransferase [Deltaproteobacteria bacterium]
MSEIILREPKENEWAILHSMNQSEVPHVNSLSLEDFLILSKKAPYAKVALIDKHIAGFLMGFNETASYQSPNFLWFKNQYPKFFYIDRVVVDRHFRRQGVGLKLYQDVEKLSSSSSKLITTEVNLEPPNPGSLKFHFGFGFKEVGQQKTEADTKTVCLMTKNLK